MTHLDLSAVNIVWLPVLPLVAVALAAIVVLLAGLRVAEDASEGLGLLALASLGVALV